MDAPVLHAKIECQCQQRIAALCLTIPCDEQKKCDDDQIPRVTIPGQELAQETDAVLLGASLPVVAFCLRCWGRTRWREDFLRDLMRYFLCWMYSWSLRRHRIFYPLAPVRAIRLWNIAVIHGISPAGFELTTGLAEGNGGELCHFRSVHGLFQFLQSIPA